MNSCDMKAQRAGLAALTESERIVVLVSRANFEIELGGFSTFFDNSAGEHAADTVAALEAVGSIQASAALRVAMGEFRGGAPPTVRELGRFEDEFYNEQPDVFSRLCSFIDAHAAELGRHES
jgi:hypothetical protein